MLLFFFVYKVMRVTWPQIARRWQILFVMGVNAYASMGLKKTMALLLAVVRIKMIQQ